MSKGHIDVDVDLNGVPQKIEQAIKRGIRESADEISDQGTDVAKNKILEEGAVWKGELWSSFEWDDRKAGKKRIVNIKNVSEHAAPMEFGAEYEDKAPPIRKLLPWVQTELSGWKVSDYWVYKAQQSLSMPLSEFMANKQLYAKAFWLQQHIKREGLEARRFMEAMEDYLWRHSDEIVGGEIDKALKKL